MITVPSPPGRWNALRPLAPKQHEDAHDDDEDRRLHERVDPEGALGVVDARGSCRVDERAAGLLVPRQAASRAAAPAPPWPPGAARWSARASCDRCARERRSCGVPAGRAGEDPGLRRHSCGPLYAAPVRIPPVIGANAGHHGADTLPSQGAQVSPPSRASARRRRAGPGRCGGGRHPLRSRRQAAGPRRGARSLRGRLDARRRSRRGGAHQRSAGRRRRAGGQPPRPRRRSPARRGDGRRRERRRRPRDRARCAGTCPRSARGPTARASRCSAATATGRCAGRPRSSTRD